jgi:phage-related minor tail protein
MAGSTELGNKLLYNRDISRSFNYGWREAFQEYVDNATNAAESAQRIFQKFTSGMEDMIVNFAKTGKLEWKSFVASMAEELLRSQLRQLFANIFSFNAGNAGGGSFSFDKLFAGFFANGGIIPGGKFGVVGERGPEFVSGPATVTPMTQPQSVIYNISAVDAASFKQLVARDPSFIHAVAQQGSRSVPGRY